MTATNGGVLLPATGSGKGSTTHGDDSMTMVGLTFRQVAILLAHYPHCNSFSFSPWNFYRLVTEALNQSNNKTDLAVKMSQGVSSKVKGSKDHGSDGLGSEAMADLTQVTKKQASRTYSLTLLTP